MALNFPNSPSNGQIFIDGASGNRWVWDSGNTCWVSTSTFTQTITVSTSQPGTPVVGQLWWNQDYGRLLVYYNDGNTSQWVDASPSDSYGIIAYSQANTSYVVANAAFNTANAAFASANNVAPQVEPSYRTANNAYLTANSAFAKANAALANTSGVTFGGNLNFEGNLTVNNFIEFGQTISYDYSIGIGHNALSAGPISIANGNVVTIPSGSVWTVT